MVVYRTSHYCFGKTENAFEEVVCKMMTLSFSPQCADFNRIHVLKFGMDSKCFIMTTYISYQSLILEMARPHTQRFSSSAEVPAVALLGQWHYAFATLSSIQLDKIPNVYMNYGGDNIMPSSSGRCRFHCNMEMPYHTLTNCIRRFDNCIQATSRKFYNAIQDDRGIVILII